MTYPKKLEGMSLVHISLAEGADWAVCRMREGPRRGQQGPQSLFWPPHWNSRSG